MARLSSLLPLAVCALLCSCMKHPADPRDPYEPLNRNIYKFNNCIDHTVYRPAAQVYHHLLPSFARTGVSNFFDNLDEPLVFTNDILQGKFRYAGVDVLRFVVNSTIGIGGLFDVANKMGFAKHYNNFGNTFAYYSDTQKSAYFVLPFLGPSTFRDAISLPFDFAAWPITYVRSDIIFYGLSALYYVNLRDQFLDKNKFLDDSFDPYAAMRDAYLERRHATITRILTQNDYTKDYDANSLDNSAKLEQNSTQASPPDEFTFDAQPTG